MSMNPEIKAKWVAALESGEYQQCQTALTRIDGDGAESHCCLGVLTELAVKEGVTFRKGTGRDNDGGLYATYGSNGISGYAPTAVADWAGLEGSNPFVSLDGVAASLAELNDLYALPFTEIAKLIREQL